MSLTNKEIYTKTIGFSIRRLLWDILATVIFVLFSALGFFILEQTSNKGLIGLGIGALVGGIVIAFLLRYVSYTYKAGQIAMMTKGVTGDKLEGDVIAEGKKIVKEHFTTVAAYFAITGIIKGIFNQLGRAITAIGRSIGGDTGNAVGSTISAVISTIVAYLCDCCLGWVFYREDVSAGKATCEGAVLFFRHGKTLAKNLGRVFGMSILSFIVVGGIFFGIFYLIMSLFPDAFANLSHEIIEAGARAGSNLPEWVSDVNTLTIVAAAVTAILLWSFIQSTFVRPFILVGVLRNYINSGIDDIPTEKSFDELDKKSDKFAKLHSEL